MKKIVVKFLQTVSPYQRGELAGFSPEVAEKLITDKKAVEHKEPKKQEPKADKGKGTASAGADDPKDLAGTGQTDPADPPGDADK